MQTSKITIYLEAVMLLFTPLVYLSVTRSNQLLNRKNNLLMPRSFFFSCRRFQQQGTKCRCQRQGDKCG